ncbi:hypothetical protein Ancab_033180 [Ancistrocladus abbreviatus]
MDQMLQGSSSRLDGRVLQTDSDEVRGHSLPLIKTLDNERDEDVFPIAVVEEIIVTNNRKEIMSYHGDCPSYTTYSSSISVGVVSDSVGSEVAGDHQPVVATPSVVDGEFSKSAPMTEAMVVAGHRVTRSNDETKSDEFENLASSRDAQCKKSDRTISLNKKVGVSGKATITGGWSKRIMNPSHNGPKRGVNGVLDPLQTSVNLRLQLQIDGGFLIKRWIDSGPLR